MSQSGVSSGKVKKRKSKKKKEVQRAVFRMLRVMETPSESTQDAASEFLGTGRTGRRNALPDILGQNAQTSCSDLPDRMQSLCAVAPEPGSTQSGSGSNAPSSNANSSTSAKTTPEAGS